MKIYSNWLFGILFDVHKMAFFPVVNCDLCVAVHIFSSLILVSITVKRMTLFAVHTDFNTKHDQLSLV